MQKLSLSASAHRSFIYHDDMLMPLNNRSRSRSWRHNFCSINSSMKCCAKIVWWRVAHCDNLSQNPIENNKWTLLDELVEGRKNLSFTQWTSRDRFISDKSNHSFPLGEIDLFLFTEFVQTKCTLNWKKKVIFLWSLVIETIFSPLLCLIELFVFVKELRKRFDKNERNSSLNFVFIIIPKARNSLQPSNILKSLKSLFVKMKFHHPTQFQVDLLFVLWAVVHEFSCFRSMLNCLVKSISKILLTLTKSNIFTNQLKLFHFASLTCHWTKTHTLMDNVYRTHFQNKKKTFTFHEENLKKHNFSKSFSLKKMVIVLKYDLVQFLMLFLLV